MCGHAWHDRMPVVGAPGAVYTVNSEALYKDFTEIFITSQALH